MYNRKFGIMFGDYIENLGLFYCTSAPIMAVFDDRDITHDNVEQSIKTPT